MPNNANAQRDEFQSLWSELPSQPRITAAQVRERAHQLSVSIRRRAIVGAVVVVVAIAQAVLPALLRSRPLAVWEWALIGYCVLFVGAWLWITRASRRQSPERVGVDCLDWYRGMLEKERDAHSGGKLAARLSIPVLSLVLLAAVSMWRSLPAATMLVAAGLAVLWGAYLWRHSRRRANLLQSNLDGLSSITD